MTNKNNKNLDTVKSRLLQFAKSQHLVMMDFYKKISIAQSNFSGKCAESALSTDKIIYILNVYPELSADWLLLGKGEMLRKNNYKNVAIASGYQTNASNGNIAMEQPVELLSILKSQQDTIHKQTDIINRLTLK